MSLDFTQSYYIIRLFSNTYAKHKSKYAPTIFNHSQQTPQYVYTIP